MPGLKARVPSALSPRQLQGDGLLITDKKQLTVHGSVAFVNCSGERAGSKRNLIRTGNIVHQRIEPPRRSCLSRNTWSLPNTRFKSTASRLASLKPSELR